MCQNPFVRPEAIVSTPLLPRYSPDPRPRPDAANCRLCLRDRHSPTLDPAPAYGALAAIRKMAPDQDPPANGQLVVNWRAGPRRRGSSRIRPDVAAASAAPPPAAPDRTAGGMGVCTSVMAAASTHRYIVFVRGSGYPARHIPAHLDPLLHIGGTLDRLESTRPLLTARTPNAERGRGIGHLPPREWPECARQSCAAVWRACRDTTLGATGANNLPRLRTSANSGQDASEAADCSERVRKPTGIYGSAGWGSSPSERAQVRAPFPEWKGL